MKLYTFTYSWVTTEGYDVMTFIYRTKEEAVLTLKKQIDEERRYYDLGDDTYDSEEQTREISNAKITHNEWYTRYHTFAYDGEHQSIGEIAEHEDAGDVFIWKEI